jgi:glycosyltransferase involved in cell wall biosynthesis
VFKPGQEDYNIDGISVYGFDTRSSRSFLFHGIFDSYNTRQFMARVKELGIEINDIKFVHCHTAHFSAYGLSLKQINPAIKVLVQHHDLDPFTVRNGILSDNFINANYRARSAMRLLRQVDIHICISEPCKANLLAFPKARQEEIDKKYLSVLKTIRGVKPLEHNNIYILNNGVDVSIFRPNDEKKQTDTFRIGCIANFVELKGHMVLLRAFDILIKKGYHNIRLSLLGTGPTRTECEDFVRQNGLIEYVEWPKEVSHECLVDYYNTLDLYAMPSSFEGFGCVYTEAAACGIPFIGCFNNGAAECIEPEERSKWLIVPGDHMKLADIIESYYHNRHKQYLCKPFDINILISDFLKYIHSL